MSYSVTIITPEKKEKLEAHIRPKVRYEIKSNIFGCCIKLLCDNRTLAQTWQENFYAISPDIRSHGRLYVFSDSSYPDNSVLFDPYAKTAFLFNITYYGWIKSIALGLAGDILEDEHEIWSVHGACVDIGGKGLCMVGTSGAGKTTQTYGLLLDEKSRIISDDWFFARIFGPEILGYGSEKNFYIRDDLTTVWKEFDGLVAKDEYDADGRAVADIRWVVGKGRLLPLTTLESVVILRHDPDDTEIVMPLSKEEAFIAFSRNGYFNPHLLIRDARKNALRDGFIRNLLDRTRCYQVNTIGTPKETQERIRELLANPSGR